MNQSTNRQIGGRIARASGGAAEGMVEKFAALWRLQGLGYLVRLHPDRTFEGKWKQGEDFDFCGHLGEIPVAVEVKSTRLKSGRWTPSDSRLTPKGRTLRREFENLRSFTRTGGVAIVLLFAAGKWLFAPIRRDDDWFPPRIAGDEESRWTEIALEDFPKVILEMRGSREL